MITLQEFIKKITGPGAAPLLMTCVETVVFERAEQVLYVPVMTHETAAMNPMGDFRTRLGHALLWCRHIEVDCSSAEMRGIIRDAKFTAEEITSCDKYVVYALTQAERPAADKNFAEAIYKPRARIA
ncbi:MAG: hypothetical protein LBN00_00780 [Oscillospiraceae bacterium]|jgi:hypothetical protein|nr:hypothetical protein [Oscillospiraceae bacterium]